MKPMDQTSLTQPDEARLAEAVSAAFRRQEGGIAASSFYQSWQRALRASAENSRTRSPDRFAWKVLAAGGLMLIGGIWLVQPLQTPEPESVFTNLSTPERLTLDPNQPWSAPTDDLLQVGVLRYESAWPVYEQFYFVTVEIQ